MGVREVYLNRDFFILACIKNVVIDEAELLLFDIMIYDALNHKYSLDMMAGC